MEVKDMKKWTVLILLMMLILTACQARNDDTAYNLRTDQSNPNFMSNRANHENINRQHQVEDDITGQNPNFLDIRRMGTDGEANRNNFGADIEIAKQVVNRSDNFELQSVQVNNSGDKMTVNVNSKGQHNLKDIKRLRKELYDSLPRYDIKVRVR
jgi:lipopolysaccharide export system protein LptC